MTSSGRRPTRPTRRLVGVGGTLAVLLTTGLASIAVPTADADRPAPEGPTARATLLLPRQLPGERVLARHADRLGALARINGMRTGHLRRILAEDPSARVSRSGHLVFRDVLHRSEPDAAPREAPYPLSQTFTLHSRPGSPRTIYLDVDGYTVTASSAWAADGMATGTYEGFSLDSDYTTFSDDERTFIQTVWQRVSEDFAPFDVDVTTADPGTAAIDRTSAADLVYGTRAVVTDSRAAHGSPATCEGEPSCTGIAFVDVFGDYSAHQAYQPAWVFSAYYDDVASVAETITHEVGHHFGLAHDGVSGGDPYYSGQGSWVPIMGSGLRPLVQWSRGEYAGADNTEDDLAIIARHAPLLADDAGDTVGTASTALPTSTPALIGTRTDVDVYALGTCSGAVQVQADPAPVSPDLDIKLTLLDAAGAVVASADPPSASVTSDLASGLDATVSTTGNGARLYAAVDGVGAGNVLTTGYSDYASLGRYTLAVTGCASGPTSSPSATASPSSTPTSSPTSSPTATPTDPVILTPSAPTIGTAKKGPKGGAKTVSIGWRGPLDDGGSPITGYVLYAYKVNAALEIVRTITYEVAPTTTRVSVRPGKGRWRFAVLAVNAYGDGRISRLSNTTTPR